MEDPRPAGLPSVDDLAAEIEALRQRLNDLERQMRLLGGRTPSAPPDRQPDTAATPGGAERPGPAAPVDGTPFTQVLTADEDTAKRHLDQLRAAIVRLREERAQAAAEFRTLTRPLSEDAAPPRAQEAAVGAASDLAPELVEPEPPAAEAVMEPPVTVVAVEDEGAALSALPSESAPVPPRAVETASHVRVAVDDVPELPGPGEAGEEAWREVRQAVLQSDAWRDHEEPGRRWGPTAAALAGAALLALAVYGLWNSGPVPSGPDNAPAAAATPSAPAPSVAPAQQAAAPTAANEAPGGPASQSPAPGTPIGTSGIVSGTTADAPPVTAPPPAAAAPAPAAAPRIEIQTTREVWMRTTVDGEAPVERLVPAGRTLRFDPAQVLVLRAGDAGAVRVVVDGDDQGVLGTDGRVANRRYELPPKKAQP